MRPDWYIGWYSEMAWVALFRWEWLTPAMVALTKLLNSSVLFTLIALGYWLHRKSAFTRAAMMLCFATILNIHLKTLFEIPRPDAVEWLTTPAGPSFPSGHAQIAAALFLWLAWEFNRFRVWVLAIGLVLGIGLSRIYLGVHTPMDVAAGFLVGGLMVAAGAQLVSHDFHWWERLSRWQQLLVLSAFMAVWLLCFSDAAGDESEPASVMAGFLAGFWTGLIFDARRLRYRAPDRWPAALLLAVTGILLLRFTPLGGLEALLALAGTPELPANFLGRFLQGLLITGLLPWLFLRLGLARRDE